MEATQPIRLTVVLVPGTQTASMASSAIGWCVAAGRFVFRASTTPLVDIAKTPWACWKGHFGVATPSEVEGSKQNEDSAQLALDDYYEVAGPRSPLWQAENGHLSADGESQPESGFCTGSSGPQAPEREAIRAGGGHLTPLAAGR